MPKEEKNRYHIEAACACNRGKVRSNNEDNFYFRNQFLNLKNSGVKKTLSFSANTDRVQCLAVFDGMGGENDGEKASYYAAKTMYRHMEEMRPCVASPREFLEAYFEEANAKICREVARVKEGRRMGTTAALLYVFEEDIYIGNIGDSRVYRFFDKTLQQLSQDHTDREFLEQVHSKNKPKLLQHLGIFPSEMRLSPFISKGVCRLGDRYLLCSDGLTDMVDEETIGGVLASEATVEGAANRLVELALSNGGKDNVTVIVCEIAQGHIEQEEQRQMKTINKRTGKIAVFCVLLSIVLAAVLLLILLKPPMQICVTMDAETPIGLVHGTSVEIRLEVEPEEAWEHLEISTEDESVARYEDERIVGVSGGTTRILVVDTRTQQILATREIRVFA